MKRTQPTDPTVMTSPEYRQFIEDLKARVISARISAARAVNRDCILLYWDIGRGDRGEAADARLGRFGGGNGCGGLATGVSRTRPAFRRAMCGGCRQFYLAYSTRRISGDKLVARNCAQSSRRATTAILATSCSQKSTTDGPTPARISATACRIAAEVPWGHHLLILNKLTDPAARLYYLRATARFGWSRNVLLNQIKAGAYERAVTEKKTHNFPLALPEHLAEQADEMLKSSYNLEFLGLRRAVKERELEDRLISRLQAFLLELGYGFCFVGRQHRLTLGQKEYFIDLLFYHRFLKALVAFDLKVGPFEPEYAGKMDFYLNLLNDKERGPDDQPSIGIILCAEKDDVEVEYALRTKANPIGVAAYQLQSKLPGELKGKLPTAKQLAAIVRAEMEAGE